MQGAQLAAWRKENALSQAELAHVLRVNRQTVIAWEKAENIPPLVEIALRAIDHRLVDLTPHRQPGHDGRTASAPSPAARVATTDHEDHVHTQAQFLANLTHELRTPLNAIIGFSEMIAREMMGPIGNAQYREYAQLINQSGNQLLDLVNAILDISKIQAGNFILNEAEFSLDEVAASATKLVAPQAEKSGVRLDVHIQPEARILFADSGAVRTILLNLLSNGIKFTPSGGRVWLDARCDLRGIEITVGDTGVGISADDLARLQKSLPQIDTRKTGAGLGLALVRGLVQAHGGDVTLESVAGAGTTVRARLPRAAIEHASGSERNVA